MKNICYINIYTKILLLFNKELNYTFAEMLTDVENIMLSEIYETEKDKYYMISLICEN